MFVWVVLEKVVVECVVVDLARVVVVEVEWLAAPSPNPC